MGCWTYYFCPCFRDKWDSMFPPPEEKREVTDKEKRAAARKAKQEEALAEVNRCDALFLLNFLSYRMDRCGQMHHLLDVRRQGRTKDGWASGGRKLVPTCLPPFPRSAMLSILCFTDC